MYCFAALFSVHHLALLHLCIIILISDISGTIIYKLHLNSLKKKSGLFFLLKFSNLFQIFFSFFSNMIPLTLSGLKIKINNLKKIVFQKKTMWMVFESLNSIFKIVICMLFVYICSGEKQVDLAHTLQ